MTKILLLSCRNNYGNIVQQKQYDIREGSIVFCNSAQYSSGVGEQRRRVDALRLFISPTLLFPPYSCQLRALPRVSNC